MYINVRRKIWPRSHNLKFPVLCSELLMSQLTHLWHVSETLCLKASKISLLISSLTIQVIQKYVIFQIFDCPNAFLSLLSDFIFLWLENMLFMTCIFVILLRFALCSEYGLFGKCIVYNWKECFRLLLREVFYKC